MVVEHAKYIFDFTSFLHVDCWTFICIEQFYHLNQLWVRKICCEYASTSDLVKFTNRFNRAHWISSVTVASMKLELIGNCHFINKKCGILLIGYWSLNDRVVGANSPELFFIFAVYRISTFIVVVFIVFFYFPKLQNSSCNSITI